MRDNYINEINKLTTTVAKMDQIYNSCRSDLNISQEHIVRLSETKGKCLYTLKHVSQTMELLSSAFLLKHNMSQNVTMQLAHSRKASKNLRNNILIREEFVTQLQLENNRLKDKVLKLNLSLSNVNGDNRVLQNQLGVIQQDVDGLKSNTTRLLGENAGLEKVLHAKKELEDHKIEAAEKVIDLASNKNIKKIKIITAKDETEDDDESNETIEDETKEIEKIVEKNIRKMTKRNKEKLKPILEAFSKSSVAIAKPSLKDNNESGDKSFESEEGLLAGHTNTKPKNTSHISLMDALPFIIGHGTSPEQRKRIPDTSRNSPNSQFGKSPNKPKENVKSLVELKNNSNVHSLTSTLLPFETTNINDNTHVDQNNILDTDIQTAMINTKKKIKKLKQFGQILKNATAKNKSKNVGGGSGKVFGDTESNIHGIIDAKEASHQIAKLVKELPNLVKL